jgi:folate-binding protein YgfZ
LPQDSSGQDGYAGLRRAAAYAERDDVGRIRVTGADRRSYLQGLLTNDISALTPGTGCYAAMLTAQGRMITDMRVLELGEAILLDVPRAVTSQIRDHLDRFIFSEDVQVEEVTASRAEIGVYGPEASRVLARCGTGASDALSVYASSRGTAAGIEALIVRSDDYGVPGFDLVVDASARDRVIGALSAAGAAQASAEDLETIRIESGRPLFGVDMDTDTIPLEAGIEDRAISRTKGCYVGQEVIVRVIDRGHGRVAKRLVGLALDPSASVPTRGATITRDGRGLGQVTSAVRSPSLGRPIALGYVHRDFVDAGTAVEVSGAGQAMVSDLPFV